MPSFLMIQSISLEFVGAAIGRLRSTRFCFHIRFRRIRNAFCTDEQCSPLHSFLFHTNGKQLHEPLFSAQQVQGAEKRLKAGGFGIFLGRR